MPTISKRLYLRLEHLLLTQCVPLDGPGPVLRWIFKAPLLFYRLGLYGLVPRNILILTTTGRKTGLPRKTPIEYGYEPGTNTYQVMAGWVGRTD